MQHDAPPSVHRKTWDIFGLKIQDHKTFHGTVLRTTLGAALGVFLLWVCQKVVGPEASSLGLFPLFALGGALGATRAETKRVTPVVLGAFLGALGGGLYVATRAHWAPFGAVLMGLAGATAVARGEGLKKVAVTGAALAAGGHLGIQLAETLFYGGWFAPWVPPPMASLGCGAVFGLFFGLSSLPRYLRSQRDPVENQYKTVLDKDADETQELLSRALNTYRLIKSDLQDQTKRDPKGEISQRVKELMMRILRIAEECRRIEGDLNTTSRTELKERKDALLKKAEAAHDPAARRAYESAHRAIEEQEQTLKAIELGRERVLARLSGHVTLLEKTRLSLLHLKSAHTERFEEQSSPVARTLEELGQELDATSSAMSEIFGANL